MRHKIRFWEAVSYRIPINVTQFVQFGDGTIFPVCPRCKISIDREYMQFCDRCGQRLAWELIEQAPIKKV